MSIIAETLQRLQKQAKNEAADTSDISSMVVLPRGKREPGWHTPPSRVKFCLAGIGMVIGLGGLGLVAYWIGFHLDFGKTTYASPNQSMFPSGSSFVPKVPSFDLPSSESTRTPDITSLDEALSTNQEAGSKTPGPPAAEESSTTLNTVGTPISQESDIPSIPSVLKQSQPQPLKTDNSIPRNAKDDWNDHASSNPKAAASTNPALTNPIRDEANSKLVESENVYGLEKPIQLIEAMKEDRGMKEFPPVSHQTIGDTAPLLNGIAMIPQKEEESPMAHSLNGVQSSPVKLLGQVQELIQEGKYEEAVSFLSPLFTDPPVNWEPWFWMGTALLGQDQLEQADQFFLSGLARNDKIPQLWVQRALVAQQQEEYQLAIHGLRRAESLDATLPHIHLNMGYAYEKLGNDRLANEYYAKFLKFSEGNPAFFSIRKKLYARLTEQVKTPVAPGFSSFTPDNPSHTDDRSQP